VNAFKPLYSYLQAAPPLPRSRKPGPAFKVVDKQELDMQRMMASMQVCGITALTQGMPPYSELQRQGARTQECALVRAIWLHVRSATPVPCCGCRARA
jgi:hypothetical protein